MQVVTCKECDAKNRVDESKLDSSQAKCGQCGAKLDTVSGVNGPGTTPIIVTDQNFETEVLQVKGVPVLLDCWAPWCGPCRIVGPYLDQLATESNGRYLIAKLNVDENQGTAAQFQVSSIPTMLIFKEGKLIDRMVGALPKQAIAARLAQAA
jgi:thioredoxin